jgi:hypothetical protein
MDILYYIVFDWGMICCMDSGELYSKIMSQVDVDYILFGKTLPLKTVLNFTGYFQGIYFAVLRE